MRRMSIQFCFGALLNLVAVNIFIFLSEMDYGGIIALLPLIVAFFIMRSFMIYVFSPDDDVSVGQVISLGSLVFAVSSLIEATIIFSTSKKHVQRDPVCLLPVFQRNLPAAGKDLYHTALQCFPNMGSRHIYFPGYYPCMHYRSDGPSSVQLPGTVSAACRYFMYY